MRTIIRPGLFRCPDCGTYYNPTYGPCPNCKSRHSHSLPKLGRAGVGLIILTLLWLSGCPLGAKPALAQTRPMPVQALFGTTYIDLNANATRDFGEPAQADILVEARHINSEINFVWSSTSGAVGDYRMLLWDPGQYHLEAHCTDQVGEVSSIYICWQSTNPLVIDGAGQVINIPLPARHLYLPIVRK